MRAMTFLKYLTLFSLGTYLAYLGHNILTKEYWIILALVFSYTILEKYEH